MAQNNDEDYLPYSLSDAQDPSQQLASLVSPADPASLVPPDISSTGPVNTGSAPAATSSPVSPAQPATASPTAATPGMSSGGRAALAALGAPPQIDMAKMQQLQQQRSQDATPANPYSAQYKPGTGLRIRRGLAALLTGGIPGLVTQNYSGPTRQYGIDEQQRQARLGQDTSQIADLEKNYDEGQKGYSDNVKYLQQRRLADQNNNTFLTTLAKGGFKQGVGPDGQPGVVEDPDSQAFKDRQTLSQLHSAQADHDSAAADLDRLKNDPTAPAFKLAMAKLQATNQRIAIAAGNLGVRQLEYKGHAYGTGADDQPLPGVPLQDDGTPVGTWNAKYNAPTGTERTKGDMAQSAHEQIGTLKSIVTSRPDIFGPAAGRKTDFNVWLGSQDPDAQRFRAARTIAGDHLAGTFGGRSEAALTALDNAIGNFKDNPAAVAAGLDQLDHANNVFLKRGTPHVAQGRSTHGKTTPPSSSGQIPSAAAAQLQEGVAHTFGNGQTWTKRKGVPVRLK